MGISFKDKVNTLEYQTKALIIICTSFKTCSITIKDKRNVTNAMSTFYPSCLHYTKWVYFIKRYIVDLSDYRYFKAVGVSAIDLINIHYSFPKMRNSAKQEHKTFRGGGLQIFKRRSLDNFQEYKMSMGLYSGKQTVVQL